MPIQTNVIFLYTDSLRRDFSTCYILQETLQALGYKTFICSRRNFLRFIRFVLPAKLFIIGQVNMLEDSFFLRENQKEGNEVFFMPAEGFAADEEYITMYPEDIDYSILNAVFFWGKNSLKWFSDHRTIDDNAKLIRAGYARLPIAREYDHLVNIKAKRIGFVGRFPAINDLYERSVMSFFLNETTERGRSQLVGRLNSESNAILCYLNLFDYIINETDYIISVRPHPNEDASVYDALLNRYKGRVEINNVFDVAEWMAGCNMIVGLASSSFIDAHLVGTPVICLDKLLNSQESTLHFDPALKWMYESCYLPDDISEVHTLLQSDQLEALSNETFNELIDNDFRGESELVFDQIISKVVERPLEVSIFDKGLLLLLKAVDFILASIHYLCRNKALQFDYSSFYHPASKVLKDVSCKIREKLDLSQYEK